MNKTTCLQSVRRLCLALLLSLSFGACGKDPVEAPKPPEGPVGPVAQTVQYLAAPTNGWELVHYPSVSQRLGGYTLFVKFDSKGTLTASSELLGSSEVFATPFEIQLASDGRRLLHVKEYNKALRLGSTETSGVENPYAELAKYGDENFLLSFIEDDAVQLVGTSSGSTLILRRATSAAWADQLEAIKKMRSQVAITSFWIKSGTKILGTGELTAASRHLAFKPNATTTTRHPYRYTATGVELYRPVKLEGESLQSFTYVEDADGPALKGSETISLKAQPADLAALFKAGLFAFDLSTMTAEGKSGDRAWRGYNRFVSRMKIFSPKFTIKSTQIGTLSGSFGAHVSLHRDADPLVKVPEQDIDYVIPIKLTTISTTEVSMALDVEKITDGSTVYLFTHDPGNTYHTEMMIAGFVNIGKVILAPKTSLTYNESYNPRSFTLSADNLYKPTKLILTDKALESGKPASVITLALPANQ